MVVAGLVVEGLVVVGLVEEVSIVRAGINTGTEIIQLNRYNIVSYITLR